MNIIQISRKPYLSILLAIVVLFVSCEQHSLITSESQVFEYSILNHFKNNSTYDNVIYEFELNNDEFKTMSMIDKKNNLVEIINRNYGSNIQISNFVLELTNLSSEEILNTSLKKGLINQTDVNLTNSLINNIQSKGFDLAIEEYKSEILKLSLTDEDFFKKNVFVNILEAMNYKQPNLFKNSSLKVNGGPWACVGAVISFAASIVGLSACATIFLCGLALAAVGLSFNNLLDKCVGEIKIEKL